MTYLLLLCIPAQDAGLPNGWYKLEALKSCQEACPILTDLECHLHPRFGTAYRFLHKMTHAHETTHAINSYCANTYARGYCTPYICDNCFAAIRQPACTLSKVGPFVPCALRKSRYNLYLYEQQRYFECEPLYVLDEWVAYINGGAVGLELAKGGECDTKNDLMEGIPEFIVYTFCMHVAINKYDPNYDDTFLRTFIRYNVERGMLIYNAAQKYPHLNWDNGQLLQTLRTAEECAPLRRWVQHMYGAPWCKEHLGF